MKENELSGFKRAVGGSVIKLNAGESITGEFISIIASKMYKDSFALKLSDKSETKIIFVNNIVADLIESNNIKSGNIICIKFIGKKKNQTGIFEFNDYELYYK